jgi:uncharacterized protein
VHDGCLRVRLTAPPVEGAVHEALVRLIADRLGLARPQVRVVAGGTARRKVLEVDGASDAQLQALGASAGKGSPG